MRRQGLGLVVVAAIAFAATPALAQDKKFDVNIGGGFTATTGEMHNHLGNGGNFMIGVTFHVNEHLGIQAEYGYTPVGSKELPVPSFPAVPGNTVPVSAGHHMHQGTFNAISRFGASDAAIRPFTYRQRGRLQPRGAADVARHGPRHRLRPVVVRLLSSRGASHEHPW